MLKSFIMKLYWKKIVMKLIEKQYIVATMESCTGGLIASTITNYQGASKIFRAGFVTYCNEEKVRQGVSEQIIGQYSVYSEETGISMAQAVKEQTKANIGIGVTGQLGRIDPSNPVDKLNHVWYCIISPLGEYYTNHLVVKDAKREKQKVEVLYAIAKTMLKII